MNQTQSITAPHSKETYEITMTALMAAVTSSHYHPHRTGSDLIY